LDHDPFQRELEQLEHNMKLLEMSRKEIQSLIDRLGLLEQPMAQAPLITIQETKTTLLGAVDNVVSLSLA
jgi:prefoldin subunit 5